MGLALHVCGSDMARGGSILPWREAGTPNHHDDQVDSDQWVVNKEISLLWALRCTCPARGVRSHPDEYL